MAGTKVTLSYATSLDNASCEAGRSRGHVDERACQELVSMGLKVPAFPQLSRRDLSKSPDVWTCGCVPGIDGKHWAAIGAEGAVVTAASGRRFLSEAGQDPAKPRATANHELRYRGRTHPRPSAAEVASCREKKFQSPGTPIRPATLALTPRP